MKKVSLKFELHNQYHYGSGRLTIDFNHEQFDIYQLTKDKEFQYPHFLPSSIVNKSLSPVIKIHLNSPFLLPSHNKNEIDDLIRSPITVVRRGSLLFSWFWNFFALGTSLGHIKTPF